MNFLNHLSVSYVAVNFNSFAVFNAGFLKLGPGEFNSNPD